MYDIIEMQKFESNKHACHKEFSLTFLESTSASHMISQIASYKQIHNQIEVFSILEGIGHVDDKRMFKFAK